MKEQKNTVVNLKTQEEYNEYMKMCEKEGWKWAEGQRPMGFNGWTKYKEETCIKIRDYFSYRSLEKSKLENEKVITLSQLKNDSVGFFEMFE